MRNVTPRHWFAAKRYGIGSSLPLTWEGWLVSVVAIVALIAAGSLMTGATRAITCGLLLAAFLAVAARKTEGGWRWRWGSK